MELVGSLFVNSKADQARALSTIAQRHLNPKNGTCKEIPMRRDALSVKLPASVLKNRGDAKKLIHSEIEKDPMRLLELRGEAIPLLQRSDALAAKRSLISQASASSANLNTANAELQHALDVFREKIDNNVPENDRTKLAAQFAIYEKTFLNPTEDFGAVQALAKKGITDAINELANAPLTSRKTASDNRTHFPGLQSSWDNLRQAVVKRNATLQRHHEILQAIQLTVPIGHIARHASYQWLARILPKSFGRVSMQALNVFGLVTMVASAPLMYVSFKQMFEQPQDQGPPAEAPPVSAAGPAAYNAGAAAANQSLSA